ASSTNRDRITRSPSLSSAPPMTMTGPTGPPSTVGASRTGVEGSDMCRQCTGVAIGAVPGFLAKTYMCVIRCSRYRGRSPGSAEEQTPEAGATERAPHDLVLRSARDAAGIAGGERGDVVRQAGRRVHLRDQPAAPHSKTW